MNSKQTMPASNRTPAAHRLRPHPLTLALACALAAAVPAGLSQAQTLPTGAMVAKGQATIATQGNQMTVTNSPGAVLNWQSFSIGSGQSVRFEQADASSQVLNRVLGRDPSQIAGRLSSNGGVWLLNPYGVMFGRDARVDVAGLVASTLNISDADWQARRFNLLGGNGAAAVVNQGEIRTTPGGQVLLVGGSAGVRNEGLIEAPGGQILLAAGASVDLADSASPHLSVRVTAPAGEAVNLGRLLATGGRIDLQAAMVNQQGIVRADGLSGGPAGEVRLSATDSLNLSAGSHTAADGGQGGRVVAVGGTTLVAGAVSAQGASGTGGSVRLLGQDVGLLAGADVNASGRSGGGGVLIGGGLQGKDPSVLNARAVYMDAGASVRSDATDKGAGGLVVLWSDKATRAYGTLSARGGANGGDGGFIETSGGWLDAQPRSVRTDAAKGKAGQWLLDPNDILIAPDDGDSSNSNVSGGPNFQTTGNSARLLTETLVAALNAGNNVTVTTASPAGHSQPGTITMQGAMTVNAPSAVSFTLNAARHIDLDHVDIFSSQSPLNINLNAGSGGAGGIRAIGSTINTTGSITLTGPSTACGTAGCAPFAGATGTTETGRGFGVSVQGSTLTAGQITVRGTSVVDNQAHGGVLIDSSSSLQALQLDIAGWTGSNALSPQHGVRVSGQLRATDRITIDGTSRVSGPGAVEGTAIGVRLDSSGGVLVGPTALDSGSGNNLDSPLQTQRRPLAADPNRWLRITGASDDRSGMFSPSVTLQGQVYVTDKAGISIRGDGGLVELGGADFDVSLAGNLLISGSSRLEVDIDDLLLPNAEPTRLTNTLGVSLYRSLFGTPSEFTIDSASGPVEFEDGSIGASLSIGSAPLTIRGTRLDVGLGGGSVDVQAGRVLVQTPRVEFGSGATIASSSTGDAITLAGPSGNLSTLIVPQGHNPLATPSGRWLVYGTNPGDNVNFRPGGLVNAFKQYNARFGSGSVLGTGNGFLFSLAPQLQVTGTVVGSTSKEYDGTATAAASLSQPSITGLLPGDTLLSAPAFGSLSFAGANAGASIPLVVSLGGGPLQVTDTQGPVFGYGVSNQVAGLTGSISPRTLSIDNLSSLDKVYDGTRDVLFRGATLGGLVGTERLTLLPGTLAFDNPNAGVGKSLTGNLLLADGVGGQARNYQLANGGAISTTASITPRPVTLAEATVADKVYDGNTAATINGGTLTGLVGAQTLTLTSAGTRFDTKDAGIGKAVTGPLLLADGSGANAGLAANYTLTNGNTLTLTGNILPRPVSLGNVSAADKVYDGTPLATVTTGALQGVVDGESISATVVGRFQSPQVGADKPVFAAVALSGAGGSSLASNYVFPGGGFNSNASITPRPVTAQGVSAANKPYDGTTTAGLQAQSFVGIVEGETLSLARQASFDTKAVGVGKTVTGRIELADGSGQASNYLLTNPGPFSGSAAITPRGLSVTAAAAADKVYDGTVTAAVSNFVLSGVLAGEQVSVAAGSGRFADADVGGNKVVTTTAASLAGADAANYALASASVQTRAGITPATATYLATPTVAALGRPLPTLTGTVAGLVAGDTVATATTGPLTFTTPATTASPEGLYPVVGSGLVARNYVFTQAPSNATALSIIRLSTSLVGEPTATIPTAPALMAALQPLPVVSSVEAHRTLDALPVLQFAPPSFVFRSLDLEGTSEKDLASMLAARDRYKKGIFADAIRELEKNPGAADAPACQTAEQAAAGNCLITEAVKPALRERLQIELKLALAPLPAPPAPPAPPAASPAATPTPPSPAPAPSTPTPVAAPLAAARPAPAAQAALRLPAARSVRTAALPQIQRKWALLIGTDVYADIKIPQLDNAVADVDAVAAVLEGKLGYQALVVRNGSKAEILRAFNQLAAAVSPADSVAIYYAGHGELIEKLNLGFWQPTDADATRAETWISNSDIGKLLGQLGASQVVLVSDSCFSGSLVSDERIRGGSAVPDAAALLSRRAATVMSSGGNEPVFDSGKNGHSTFAWSFMRALESVPTWRPGSNIFERVRFDVARQVPQRPQYGASRLGGHQPGADYVFEQRQLDALTK